MDTSLEELKYPTGRYQRPEGVTPELQRSWISAIEALPQWLDICIENLDAHQLQTPYRDGGWTVQQVVHHIADSHMNAYIRLKLALTEDNPTVKPYEENAWANLPDTHTVPVNVSTTLVHALHRRMVAVFDGMSESDWNRTFFHPDHKRNIPVWELAALYAWHGRHHIEHIRQLRQRMNW